MMAKKILITGACGYIGSHTVVDLIENGYEVVSIDNFVNSYPSALEGIQKITNKTVKNYNIDLCNFEALKIFFEENTDIEGIIHFAALKAVNESVQEPILYYKNNIVSLLNILECCSLFQIQNFVFSSSCSVYGNSKELPVKETTALAKTECPYAETKLMAERIINDYSLVNNFKVSILRYFNPIGAHISGLIGENQKGTPQNVIPRLTGTAKGEYKNFNVYGTNYNTRDGSCIRDYIHVSDIAHGHTLSLDWLFKQSKKCLEVFNMGSGNGVSVLELIDAFEQANDIKLNTILAEKREGDVIAIYADNSKAEKVLRWKPKHNLKEMMSSVWKWESRES